MLGVWVRLSLSLAVGLLSLFHFHLKITHFMKSLCMRVQSSGAVWTGRWAWALVPYPFLPLSLMNHTVSVDVKPHEWRRRLCVCLGQHWFGVRPAKPKVKLGFKIAWVMVMGIELGFNTNSNFRKLSNTSVSLIHTIMFKIIESDCLGWVWGGGGLCGQFFLLVVVFNDFMCCFILLANIFNVIICIALGSYS